MSQMPPAASSTSFSVAAIFSRTLEMCRQISPEVARHILSLNISEEDQTHLRSLLEKNTSGSLSDREKTELENILHIADLISLWHSRARRSLEHVST